MLNKKKISSIISIAILCGGLLNAASVQAADDVAPVQDNTIPSSENNSSEQPQKSQESQQSSTTKKPSKKKAKKISAKQKKWLKKTLKKWKFKGHVTIYTNGKQAYSATTANHASSAYLINSVQKALTAGMLMQQVNKGKIKLTDKVAKYYPKVPHAKKITILQLLRMTSGLTQKGSLGTRPYKSDSANARKTIRSLRFNKKYYNKWHYADVNYVLISHILEKVTHKSYEKLFAQTYTKPLKLKNTRFIWHKHKNVASPARKINYPEVHALLGAGSVAMSNHDLYRALSSLLNGKFFTFEQMKQLYHPGNSKSHYCAGFYNYAHYRGSNGADYGYYTIVRISKDGKNAVIFQTNRGKGFGTWKSRATKVYKKLF